MTEELTRAIETKLAQLVKLLAVDITRGLPRTEQIEELSRAGLSVGEIADKRGAVQPAQESEGVIAR